MRTLVIVVLCIAMSGCFAYDQQAAYADRLKFEAEIAKQQAGIIALYRGCLEKYQDDPAKAKANCEHYTQALHSVDLRGLK
jgi:hypothetical protein